MLENVPAEMLMKEANVTVSQVRHGDCLEVLRGLTDNSLDSLVTDPPAGIAFMGKEWDSDKGGRDQWIAWLSEVMKEVLRVLKPGAHGLVWSLPRTSHWTAMALENAGFEVRDCVSHLFGTGFPKSQNISKAIDRAAGAKREVVGSYRVGGNALTPISEKGGTYGVGVKNSAAGELMITAPATDAAKEWDGWGTALKPACELWWLIRKPIAEKTIAAQVLKTGTGAINIDGCRIAHANPDDLEKHKAMVDNIKAKGGTMGNSWKNSSDLSNASEVSTLGRWPANVVLSHNDCDGECTEGCPVAMLDAQSAVSRFFYCAKASPRDREDGLEAFQRKRNARANVHPTVKSTELMRCLCRLVTPPGGIVLDPFCGSGSTGKAAALEGFGFLGIEQSAEYVDIARARVAHALNVARGVTA